MNHKSGGSWLDGFWDPEGTRAKEQARVDGEAALQRLREWASSTFASSSEGSYRKSRLMGAAFWLEQAGPRDALAANENVVDKIFTGGLSEVDAAVIRDANEELIDTVRREGVAHWIAAVKRHHDPTYRHSMLVNGIAAGFAVSLGFSRSDCQRMTLASMLHDIGKARVPVEILDAPRKLTAQEFEVIKLHPGYARDMLVDTAGIDDAVRDAVVHHHEYLDGSGYPDRLSGSAVQDLCRLLTIADVFSALIEDRAYKPGKSPAEAFEILTSMEGKLDRALVRAFRPLAESAAQG